MTWLRSWRCTRSQGRPPLQQLTNSLYQPLLGQWLDQKRVSTGIARACVRSKNAEYQHDRVREFRILLDGAAQCQSIQLWNHDLGHDDGWTSLAHERKGSDAIFRKVDRIAGFVQKERFELADVWVALDNKD